MIIYKEKTLYSKIKCARAYARREYIKAHNGYELPPWIEIHHKDYCPLNNTPTNWKALTKWVHIDLHSNDVNSEKSRKALSEHLSRELDRKLNELTLLCNIHNTEYGKHVVAKK
jgi:hypothetical protein